MAQQPYPGLRPFEPDETDIFFGRESHVDAMVNRLAQHRLLAVTGTSGSGKSSLVKAGLIEALEIGLLAEAGAVWHIAQLRPRDHPMAELAAALISALGGDRYEHDIALRRAALERGPLALVEELVERPLPGGANLFILVDQFEELFRYRGLAGREEAEAFVALLLASAGQRTVPIYIVLTMRSDYFGECAQFQGLAEAVSDAQYLCPRLTREQITAAIESPAAVFGGKVEPLLVSRMLNDMGTNPDQLPLMQHALMRLWDEAKVRDATAPVLRLQDYLAVDGLKGSLSRHADEILAEVTRDAPQRAETARRLFCLVTEGEGERAVRRLARVGEVMDVSGEPLAEVTLVADAFRAPGRSLLMPPLERPLDPDTVLDISHESLIRQWGVLKEWVRAEAASAEQYRDTERRARRWAAGEAGLWAGTDLDIGLAWREREHPVEAWSERYGRNFALATRFLDESKAHRDAIEAEQSRAERRRHRRIIAGFATVLIVAALFIGLWFDVSHQRTQAANALNLTESILHLDFPGARGLDEMKNISQQIRSLGETSPSLLQSLARWVMNVSGRYLNSPDGTEDGLIGATVVLELFEALKNREFQSDDELLRSAAGSGSVPKGQADFAKAFADYYDHLIKLDKPEQKAALWQINETIGDRIQLKGHFDEALVVYRYSIGIENEIEKTNHILWQNRSAATNKKIGDVLRSEGNLDAAHEAYEKAREIAASLGAAQSWPVVEAIGDALKSMGRFEEAIEVYQKIEEIAKQQPKNLGLQNESLTVSKKIGDIRIEQDQLANALDAYRDALAVANNLGWVSSFRQYEAIGDALKSKHRFDEALAFYREGLAAYEKQPPNATSNTAQQIDPTSIEGKIGDILVAQGLYDEAIIAYRNILTMCRELAQKGANGTAVANLVNRLFETDGKLSDILREHGSHDDVSAAHRAVIEVAKDLGADRLATFSLRIGDTLKDEGHLDEALAAYGQELDAAKQMFRDNPSDDNIRLSAALADERIGDALRTEGQLDEALSVYGESLNIREELANKYPENSQWQFLKALSRGRVSSILALQGRLDDSLQGYNIRLGIYTKLADKQPSYPSWRQYKAEGYNDIGDVLKAQDKLDEALVAYNEGAKYLKKLKEDYPGNLEYRSDLSRSYAAIGFILAAQGHLDEALAAHQKSLEIRVELVNNGPPSNAKQRDLAVTRRRIGDVHMAQNHFDEAFAEYTESLKIDEALTKKDPINAEWQDDLAESYEGIGEALKAQARNKEALDAYKRGSDIRRTLAQKTPSNVVWQTDLAVNLYKVAFLSGDAKGNLDEAQKILSRLDAAGKLRPSARGWIAKVEAALAEIKT